VAPVTIANPILNSPYREPARHFRFDDEGITDEIVEKRRLSGYFVPIPQPRKKGAQLSFETEWTDGRFKETEFINRIREAVGKWRLGGHVGVTSVTRRLLEHWTGARSDKSAKVVTARAPWVPAVNNHGGFGRWAFVEIADVYDAIGPIRQAVSGETGPPGT
jgi:hypothetical protein